MVTLREQGGDHRQTPQHPKDNPESPNHSPAGGIAVLLAAVTAMIGGSASIILRTTLIRFYHLFTCHRNQDLYNI